MSFNIMDMVKEQMSNQVVGSLNNLLGGDIDKSASAISGTLPSLLGGLLHAGQSHSGATAMFDTINKQDDSLLDNIGDFLGGDKQTSLISNGTDALSSIFGDKGVSGLSDVISGFSGTSKSGVTSMLGMLTPLIFSLLKRKLIGSAGGFNAGSLMNLLNDQKENIQAATPAGLADKLDFNALIQAPQKAPVVEEVQEITEEIQEHVEEEKTGGSLLGKLVPLLLLAGAGYYAFNAYQEKQASHKEAPQTTSTIEKTEQAAPVVEKEETTQERETVEPTAPKETTQEVEQTTTKSKEVLPADVSKLGVNVVGALENILGGFAAIKDVESAKAVLPDLESATAHLEEYAAVAETFPPGARGQITNVVAEAMPRLQKLLNTASQVPGVGNVLKPVVHKLVKAVSMFK